MKKLLLGLLGCVSLFGYQSISVPSSNSQNVNITSNAMFNNINDFRFTIRVTDFTKPSAGNMQIAPFGVINIFLDSNGNLCAQNNGDSMPDRGNIMCINSTGLNDVTLRAQRLAVYGVGPPAAGFTGSNDIGGFALDAYDNTNKVVLQSYCSQTGANTFPCPIKTANANRSAAGSNAMSAPAVGSFSIAYIKWSSTTVKPGSPITESELSATGDLADFTFEGNNTNNAGTAISISGALGGITYPGSRVQIPNCIVQSAVYRAGLSTGPLFNSSYPLNGDSSITSQFWQQMGGANILVVRTPTSANPTLTNSSFGSYPMLLVVKDSGNRSTACTANITFAASDNNFVTTSGNTSFDLITGPSILYGHNAINYMDDVMTLEDSIQIPNLVTYYGGYNPPWQNAAAGTITITQNSQNVTGVGTAFQTLFGGAPGNTTPTANKEIVIWYPCVGISPSGTCRAKVGLNTLTDQTHLVMSQVWNFQNDPRMSPVSGGSLSNVQYSIGDSNTDDSVWIAQNSQAGFYEAGLAFYQNYLRTGDITKLNAFNLFMKNYMDYRLDWGNQVIYGQSYKYGFSQIYWQPVAVALYGLLGNTQAWQALTEWEAFCWNMVHTHFPWSENSMTSQLCGEVCDNRDVAYQMRVYAANALFNPNATDAATARGHLDTFMQNYGATKDLSGLPTALPYGNVFYYWDQGGNFTLSNSWETGSTVTCNNGSSTCTCATGTCNFSTAGGSNQCNSFTEWGFTNTGTVRPTNNSQFVGGAYVPTACTATTITLDRPFSGTSGTFGWTVGEGGNPIVGFGTQTYESGLQLDSMGLAMQALKCTGGPGVPTNCNDTTANNIQGYMLAITNWLQTYSYSATRLAPFYYAGFVENCLTGLADNQVNCSLSSFNPGQNRNDGAPLMGGIIRGYMVNPNPGLLAFGDLITSAIYGRPYFGVTTGSTDLFWTSDYDPGYGGAITGVPPIGQAHKYYGMAFGIGKNPAWLGARIGGLTPANMVSFYVAGNIGAVAGATKMQVTVTEMSGVSETPIVCTTSPCLVSGNKSLGSASVQVSYLNNSNVVLAVGSPVNVVLQ